MATIITALHLHLISWCMEQTSYRPQVSLLVSLHNLEGLLAKLIQLYFCTSMPLPIVLFCPLVWREDVNVRVILTGLCLNQPLQ